MLALMRGFDKLPAWAFTPVTAHTEERGRYHGLGT